jgi:hypothetical protein
MDGDRDNLCFDKQDAVPLDPLSEIQTGSFHSGERGMDQ